MSAVVSAALPTRSAFGAAGAFGGGAAAVVAAAAVVVLAVLAAVAGLDARGAGVVAFGAEAPAVTAGAVDGAGFSSAAVFVSAGFASEELAPDSASATVGLLSPFPSTLTSGPFASAPFASPATLAVAVAVAPALTAGVGVGATLGIAKLNAGTGGACVGGLDPREPYRLCRVSFRPLR